MWRRWAAVVAVLGLGACAGGMRFELINLERPGSDIGLAPPADFAPCYAGHAEGVDTSGDGKPDYIRVRDANGKDTCHGTDTDHDGKIDQWDVVDHDGKVVRRARDTNGDGRADEHWTYDPNRLGCPLIFADKDGDGRPDSDGRPLDLCNVLSPVTSVSPAPSASH